MNWAVSWQKSGENTTTFAYLVHDTFFAIRRTDTRGLPTVTPSNNSFKRIVPLSLLMNNNKGFDILWRPE